MFTFTLDISKVSSWPAYHLGNLNSKNIVKSRDDHVGKTLCKWGFLQIYTWSFYNGHSVIWQDFFCQITFRMILKKQKNSIFILQVTEMEMPQEIQQFEMSDLRMNRMVRPQVLHLVLRPLLVEVQVRKLKWYIGYF